MKKVKLLLVGLLLSVSANAMSLDECDFKLDALNVLSQQIADSDLKADANSITMIETAQDKLDAILYNCSKYYSKKDLKNLKEAKKELQDAMDYLIYAH